MAPGQKDTMVWDIALPGFGVRLRPGSTQKRFYVQYRLKTGQQRKRPIGRYGVLTVEEARAAARQWLAAVELGDDPAAHMEQVTHTVADMAARFLVEHAARKNKPNSQRQARSFLRHHVLPALGHLEVHAVTRADVVALQARLGDRPTLANRVLALVSILFTCAEQWEWRVPGTHPVLRVPRFVERPRERYLTPEELARLWQVLRDREARQVEHPSVLGGIRLLLLTGARVGEIVGLQWSMIDWRTSSARLLDSKTGPKTLYCAPETLEVLRHLPRVAGNPYVLPGAKDGKPWQSLGQAWRRIRVKAGLPDVRLHDLRHTYAAYAAGAGLSLPQIGALLGHKRAQTTQRYAHIADAVAHAAAAQTGKALARVLRGQG